MNIHMHIYYHAYVQAQLIHIRRLYIFQHVLLHSSVSGKCLDIHVHLTVRDCNSSDNFHDTEFELRKYVHRNQKVPVRTCKLHCSYHECTYRALCTHRSVQIERFPSSCYQSFQFDSQPYPILYVGLEVFTG